MKWGERRFQDENGRLTPLGKVRYGLGKLTGSNARKDYTDFEGAETYYRSWAESHQKIRNDEIAKANDYQRQLEKVKKSRADYAASPWRHEQTTRRIRQRDCSPRENNQNVLRT